MPTWPPRRHLCLDCRTLQPADPAAGPVDPPRATCVAGARHRLVDLDAPAGRNALVDRVWGDASTRARVRTAAKVGGTGGGLGGALDACGSCGSCGEVGGSLGEFIAVVMVVAIAFIAAYVLFLGVRALWRWWRRPVLVPRGATAPGLDVGPRTGRTGRVVARATAPAAIGDAPCVGFALEAATRRRGERVVLRDGATVGFEVALDDGGVVVVPAGALVLDLGDAPTADAGPAYQAHLAAIDPHHRRVDDFDPFAATHVRQAVLRDGDRVEVRGPLRALPADGAGPAYRADATGRWAPADVPRLTPVG